MRALRIALAQGTLFADTRVALEALDELLALQSPPSSIGAMVGSVSILMRACRDLDCARSRSGAAARVAKVRRVIIWLSLRSVDEIRRAEARCRLKPAPLTDSITRGMPVPRQHTVVIQKE